MNIEITEISVMRAAKVGALIGFLYGVLMLPLMALGHVSTSSWMGTLAMGAFVAALLPVMGIAYGAMIGAVGALCYNFVATRWGGLVIATREVPDTTAQREASPL